MGRKTRTAQFTTINIRMAECDYGVFTRVMHAFEKAAAACGLELHEDLTRTANPRDSKAGDGSFTLTSATPFEVENSGESLANIASAIKAAAADNGVQDVSVAILAASYCFFCQKRMIAGCHPKEILEAETDDFEPTISREHVVSDWAIRRLGIADFRLQVPGAPRGVKLAHMLVPACQDCNSRVYKREIEDQLAAAYDDRRMQDLAKLNMFSRATLDVDLYRRLDVWLRKVKLGIDYYSHINSGSLAWAEILHAGDALAHKTMRSLVEAADASQSIRSSVYVFESDTGGDPKFDLYQMDEIIGVRLGDMLLVSAVDKPLVTLSLYGEHLQRYRQLIASAGGASSLRLAVSLVRAHLTAIDDVLSRVPADQLQGAKVDSRVFENALATCLRRAGISGT